MNLEPKLRELEAIYNELEQKMSDPAVAANVKEMQTLSKKHAELSNVVSGYREYKKAQAELADAQELANSADHDMAEMAKEEIREIEPRILEIEEELRVALLPKDPNDDKNVIVEIRAGTGGDEASLFAADLFRMYSRYAERQGWKMEIIDASETEVGGYKEIVFQIYGHGVYSQMKYESGVHRVQRVPETEAGGRIHTSAATVAVLPEAEDVDVEVRAEDLKIDTYRSSGAGGQHVNMTDSAVRITHLPTGIVVSCQNERSQHMNKATAMQVLKSKLYEKQCEERQAEMDSLAGEKKESSWGNQIRSYVLHPYTMVKDHRTGEETGNVNAVLNGALDEFILAYLRWAR